MNPDEDYDEPRWRSSRTQQHSEVHLLIRMFTQIFK